MLDQGTEGSVTVHLHYCAGFTVNSTALHLSVLDQDTGWVGEAVYRPTDVFPCAVLWAAIAAAICHSFDTPKERDP